LEKDVADAVAAVAMRIAVVENFIVICWCWSRERKNKPDRIRSIEMSETRIVRETGTSKNPNEPTRKGLHEHTSSEMKWGSGG